MYLLNKQFWIASTERAIKTFVQALIFSTLTLVFILAAVESHHEEGHEEGEVLAAEAIAGVDADQGAAASA